MASSNALAGLGSHLKLSLYRLCLQALIFQNEGRTLLGGQRRRMSSYTSNYSRRLEQAEARSKLESEDKQVDLLRQLNKVDPESVIRWFESRPLPHLSSAAMAEYVKALVKVDRLDESALLKTLQRGAAASGSGMASESNLNVASAAAPILGGAGVMTKEGLLGTPQAPIHMVTAEGGIKVQAWRTLHTLALGFLLISGVGALIEDRGIGKGRVLHVFMIINKRYIHFNGNNVKHPKSSKLGNHVVCI